jgi:hypothetical protein
VVSAEDAETSSNPELIQIENRTRASVLFFYIVARFASRSGAKLSSANLRVAEWDSREIRSVTVSDRLIS